MTISIIAAHTLNKVIGKNNGLPWNLPDDMKYFMQTTKKHHVIMGRKNYESIPDKFRPLPNRTNIVMTRQKHFNALDCLVVHSLQEGLNIAKKAEEAEVFVIGGSDIFKLAMPIANKLYLTEIQTTLPGDTYFPEINRSEWKEISRKHHPVDDRHAFAFDFVVYLRS